MAVHVALIAVHATAATVCFAFGLTLLIAPAGSARRFAAFAVAAVVAVLALIAVVAGDWSGLVLMKRIAFAALCGLAVYLLIRVEQARRLLVRQPTGWHRGFLAAVGFVLISLFDGFCIVSAIDLRLPPVVIGVVAVLGVVAGVLALRAAIRRESARQAIAPAA